MKPLWGALGPCALALLAAGASPAQAAWCNVFQVCWHRDGRQPVVSGYAPSACCPQPACCTTQYQARCYYEPVTAYQTRSYYEQVTTYRTSYYYEPVTSCRTSYYYDPCTCSYQQVSTPVTTLQMRAKTCPVTSWVQRCASVPVTTYRQVTYYEPVTVCSTPPAAPPCCPPSGSPGVIDRPGSPGVNQYQQDGAGASLHRYPTPPQDPGFKAPDRQPLPRGQSPELQGRPTPPPTVKLDRIVALPPANVEGQVTRSDNAPLAGAEVLFVSADARGTQERVKAGSDGSFRATLASGQWLVYLTGPDGKPAFQRKIDVGERPQPFRLVSR